MYVVLQYLSLLFSKLSHTFYCLQYQKYKHIDNHYYLLDDLIYVLDIEMC